MSINFATLQGLTIPEGNVTQITDASGRVLWSSTIKFTINGDTYIADRGMTWAEWFASDYNTTGETEGDITDANGNEVSMDAVIVDGTVYEVGFAPPIPIITITGAGNSADTYISIGGTKYYSATTVEVPVGTVISCHIAWYECDDGRKGNGYVKLNGVSVNSEKQVSTRPPAYKGDYDYTVASSATIKLNYVKDECSKCGGKYNNAYITITET